MSKINIAVKASSTRRTVGPFYWPPLQVTHTWTSEDETTTLENTRMFWTRKGFNRYLERLMS